MKITCPRAALQAALQAAAACAAHATTVPALKNVKAVARDGALTLIAYDPAQGVGIRYTLPGVTVARAGACILPKDQLGPILRECRAAEVSLDAGADAIAVSADGRYELRAMDPEAFPDVPELDPDAPCVEVAADVLREMIRRTAFAADRKNAAARFNLTGVLFDVLGAELKLAGTDTKRLAVCAAPLANPAPPADDPKPLHLIPLKALAAVERSLGDGGTVRVALRAADALFATDTVLVSAALLSGRFPPYRTILQKARGEATQKVALPVGPFLARVRQAAIMADAESQRVDLLFEAGKVTMTARGHDTGSSEVALDLPAHAGPTTEIAFDPLYLIEFLKTLDADATVTLEMSTGLKPAVFAAEGGYTYMVMPLTG